MSIYCVYLTIYRGNKLPPFYIGSTSIKKVETGYTGSVSSKKWKTIYSYEQKHNKHLFRTLIISKHSTRDSAYEKENKLQTLLNVKNNPLYINECTACGNGRFGNGMAGKTQKASSKTLIGLAHKGKTVSIETRKLQSQRQKDYREQCGFSTETIKKLRLSGRGSKSKLCCIKCHQEISSNVQTQHYRKCIDNIISTRKFFPKKPECCCIICRNLYCVSNIQRHYDKCSTTITK